MKKSQKLALFIILLLSIIFGNIAAHSQTNSNDTIVVYETWQSSIQYGESFGSYDSSKLVLPTWPYIGLKRDTVFYTITMTTGEKVHKKRAFIHPHTSRVRHILLHKGFPLIFYFDEKGEPMHFGVRKPNSYHKHVLRKYEKNRVAPN